MEDSSALVVVLIGRKSTWQVEVVDIRVWPLLLRTVRTNQDEVFL